MRELENAIERAVVLSTEPVLSAGISRPWPRTPASPRRVPAPGLRIPGSTLAEIEREAIQRTLESVSGSTSRAAKILGISPRKIQYKLKEYQTRTLAPVRGRRRSARE